MLCCALMQSLCVSCVRACVLRAQIKEYVKKHFKNTEVFDYACEIEKVTTKKKSNLILNVDGQCTASSVSIDLHQHNV